MEGRLSRLPCPIILPWIFNGDESFALEGTMIFYFLEVYHIHLGLDLYLLVQWLDGNARVSNIIAVDIQANNGVLHIVDKVILPF